MEGYRGDGPIDAYVIANAPLSWSIRWSRYRDFKGPTSAQCSVVPICVPYLRILFCY